MERIIVLAMVFIFIAFMFKIALNAMNDSLKK